MSLITFAALTITSKLFHLNHTKHIMATFAKRVGGGIGSSTYEVMISDLTADMLSHFKVRATDPVKGKFTKILSDRVKYQTGFQKTEKVELKDGKDENGVYRIEFIEHATLEERLMYEILSKKLKNSISSDTPSAPSAPAVAPSNVDRMPEFDSE